MRYQSPYILARYVVTMFLAGLLCCGPALAAEDMLGNVPPQPGPNFEPGALILLPDGRRAIIDAYLPDGNIRTDIGVILTPQGLITDGVHKGESVTLLVPDKPEDPSLVAPKQPQTTPQPPKAPEKAEIIPPTAPDQPDLAKPKAPAKPVAPEAAKPTPPVLVSPEQKPEARYTLAELLPLTPTAEPEQPEKAKETPKAEKTREKSKTKQPEEQPKAEKPKQEHKPQKPNEQHKAEKPKEQPKKEQSKKDQPKPEKQPEPKRQKARPGQELRIPKEAAKNGDLTFLEGCWQGTRPEYYSKRTIRECFCFGANGKTGKRRVFDPQGHRQCIGSTRARLSPAGVLSVTSSGAACNDGERWGQAEMICRNSGPRTPCSWVFRDANNGRQSYEIPFVRVESCGR